MPHKEDISTKDYPHVTIELVHDADCQSPMDRDGEIVRFMCLHRRYNLGHKHEFKEPEDFERWWAENGKGGHRKPLYMMDHSGLALSLSKFSCPWDSGQLGYVYVLGVDVNAEFGGELKRVEDAMQTAVSEYSSYLGGDCWGYVIKNTDGEELDSCWGFIGDDYVKTNALEAAARCNADEAERKAKEFAEAAQAERPDMAPAD